MSTIADFNRIEKCDKIAPDCIDAYSSATLNEEDAVLCVETSWGKDCVDLSNVIKNEETLTTLYLSPEESPNCLVYEPERGDNICIHGDDLSRIISMAKLKDVDQTDAPEDGEVYMYDGQTNLFKPYDLKTTIQNINTALGNLQTAVSNLQSRVTRIEEILTPPADAPAGVKVVFGNVNTYSDSNAVINSSGVATTLDKTHGLYTHLLANNTYGDLIQG